MKDFKMMQVSRRRGKNSKSGWLAMYCAIEAVEARMMLSGSPVSPELGSLPTHPILVLPRSGGGATQDAGSTSASGLGYTSTQVRDGYGLGAIGSSNIVFGSIKGDGTGQTIALIDENNDPTIASDLSIFDTAMGLPAPPSFQILNQSGQASPLPSNDIQNPSSGSDWAPEVALDVEWSHTMAPGASLILMECSNLEVGDATAAGIAGVSVISNSWGSSESLSEATSQDPYFTTPSGHAGVSFFASTGDTGAEVSYPAESPNVVAVGGTALTLSGVNWSSETTWSSGGGGTSAYEAQPSYQAGTITATKRETPDISLDASPNTGVPIYDAWDYGTGTGWAGVYGGTSLSSPMMAGLVAVADQGRVAEGLSTLNSSQTLTRLYQLSKANFHDITTGSNGHAAVVGYDEATGIGSPIGNILVPDLAGAGTVTGRLFADNAGTGVYASNDTVFAGQSVYLDLNNDGVQDNSEPSATTNAQGIYSFTDEPAGGSVRLVNPTITGYTLNSASSASLSYGQTDTANFIYRSLSTALAVVQQPSATTVGATMSPVSIALQNSSGSTVLSDTSTVTLTLSGGTFAGGGTTATAAAVNGVATFSNLQIGTIGTFSFTASDGTLTTATTSTFNVTKGTPTVSWTAPASIAYGTPLSATQLDATASVDGSFAYSPALGTVLSAGTNETLSVTFTPTDSTDYGTANGTTTISVSQVASVLSWTKPTAIPLGTPLGSTQLDATANTAGTFVYTPAAGTLLGAGVNQVLGVTFTPTDTVDYTSASASTTINVQRGTPVITWSNPTSIPYGTALGNAQLNATASVSGTFVYSPAAGTVLGLGSNQALSVTFTPDDQNDYKVVTGSATINVVQATPTISWANPAPIFYGTALSSTELDATANVPGSFIYTPAAGTVLNPGTGQPLSLSFTPTDTTDYTNASATVSIDVTGVSATPINLTGSTFYVKLDSASPQNVDIWTNSNASGTPALVQAFSTVSSITLSSVAAGDSFTADFSNGSVVPTGGLTFTGFGSASGNTVTLVGTGGSDTVNNSAATGTVSLNSQSISYSNTSSTVFFAPVGSSQALNVSSGSVSLVPSTSGGISTDPFNSINIGSGATLIVPRATTSATRLLVQTGSLAISGSATGWTGTLDLANNDLDLANGNLGTVNSQVAQGYATGIGGIISSVAETDPASLTALGVIQNSVDGTTTGAKLYGSGTVMGLFDSANPASTDVLVKYTYFGDANLDGTVDGSDYSLIDNGFNNQLSGWVNGDFNYDKSIDGSDYTLIDNAFNTQGVSIQSTIAAASVIKATTVVDSVASPATGSKSSTAFSNSQVPIAAWLQTWSAQTSSVASVLTGLDSDKLDSKSIFSADQILE